MQKITAVDIQHKTFKRKLQGYDPTDVDQYLDEVIEVLEDDAHQRAALQAEIADLKERISHFKAMEESLQNTLVLAQRTADETKASAHKEADLIREQARIAAEKEVANYNDAISEVRREHQRTIEAAEKSKSELRSLLMTHLALLDKQTPAFAVTHPSAADVKEAAPVQQPLPSGDASAAETDGEGGDHHLLVPSDDTQRITVY